MDIIIAFSFLERFEILLLFKIPFLKSNRLAAFILFHAKEADTMPNIRIGSKCIKNI